MRQERTLTGRISLTFSYAAGETASRFFAELRDHQRIMGTRCPQCRRVLVPARSFCPRCFVGTTEWLATGPQGTLASYTIVPRKQPLSDSLLASSPTEPLIYGLIQLDGADTFFVHYMGEIDLRKIQVGMKVQAVFREKRDGSILDIAYFTHALTNEHKEGVA
jgi:uncharacterized OB-fold protein